MLNITPTSSSITLAEIHHKLVNRPLLWAKSGSTLKRIRNIPSWVRVMILPPPNRDLATDPALVQMRSKRSNTTSRSSLIQRKPMRFKSTKSKASRQMSWFKMWPMDAKLRLEYPKNLRLNSFLRRMMMWRFRRSLETRGTLMHIQSK